VLAHFQEMSHPHAVSLAQHQADDTRSVNPCQLYLLAYALKCKHRNKLQLTVRTEVISIPSQT
jgi:hypothetical protein